MLPRYPKSINSALLRVLLYHFEQMAPYFGVYTSIKGITMHLRGVSVDKYGDF